MPRTTAGRTSANETNLRRRLTAERERRGWTYDGTAQRVTEAGCRLQPSSVYKIEKGDPPRRILVDELVGFAAAFGLSVEELLLPVEAADDARLGELLANTEAARRAADAASAALKAALVELFQHVDRTMPDEQAVTRALDALGLPSDRAEALRGLAAHSTRSSRGLGAGLAALVPDREEESAS